MNQSNVQTRWRCLGSRWKVDVACFVFLTLFLIKEPHGLVHFVRLSVVAPWALSHHWRALIPKVVLRSHLGTLVFILLPLLSLPATGRRPLIDLHLIILWPLVSEIVWRAHARVAISGRGVLVVVVHWTCIH